MDIVELHLCFILLRRQEREKIWKQGSMLVLHLMDKLLKRMNKRYSDYTAIPLHGYAIADVGFSRRRNGR